ncbi:DUF4848 domain-containing protein [Flagellimonas onchidii]|uniref:DUF4848 domain-containing protein n=1 Tax=Flagellimonas onchidii TaxID=2562684 RepID=UPI0010A5D8F9|nr:DUF4848 domain-containing protein [Allomuricauda onchidii]
MKKSYLFGILYLLFVFGCEKNDSDIENGDKNSLPSEQSLFQVLVNDGMLDFPSRGDYDQALDYLGQMSLQELEAWNNNLGFKSMKTEISESEREENGIYDDLLATLINTKSEIKIGDYILRLDALGEKVYVTTNSKDSKKILNNKDTRIFSTDDNVLDILNGEVDDAISAKSRYCGKRKLSWNLNFSTTPSKIHAKVVYQKAGFLNSLQSKIEEELGLDGTSKWKMFLKTNGSGNFWRNKKKSGTIGPYQSSIFNKANKSYRPYYSSRRLKAYKFSIEFWAQSENDGVLRKKTITIDCN